MDKNETLSELIKLAVVILLFILLVILVTLIIQKRKIIIGSKDTYATKNLKKFPRSKAEAEAIKVLESITNKKFPTVNPSWLKYKGKTLELDGYNDTLKLALEFSGPLHTKWTPSFEPYPIYFKRIVKDIKKKELCAKHNVNLIVLDISLPVVHYYAYFKSRLYDFGIIEDKPSNYIIEQIIEPFRNYQLENEMNLKIAN